MESLKINGKTKEFPAGLPATLTELLQLLKIHEATVVAEINGQIIERNNFSKTALCNGQSVELVRFVGGG